MTLSMDALVAVAEVDASAFDALQLLKQEAMARVPDEPGRVHTE
jgi:hypothetical protein